MFIDSTVPYLYLPQVVCDQFESAFQLQYDDVNELYTINSTAQRILSTMDPSFTFTLADMTGQTITVTLPFLAFNLTASFPLVQSETNYFPLKRATNSTQYTLGRAFLQEAYIIADYQRSRFSISQCSWPATFTENLVAILPPDGLNSSTNTTTTTAAAAARKSAPTGAIVGGVVGGVVVIIISIFIGYHLVYKPAQRRKKSPFTLEEAADITEPKPELDATDQGAAKFTSTELAGNGVYSSVNHAQETCTDQLEDTSRRVYNIEAQGEFPSELNSTPIHEMAAREPVGNEL
ncbi:hypothetical protein BP6252_13893 [Coleophoma cylindrospora]|uniref:Peptidase A1 domain-containing protein n=1 Tax=Coleophoma cylindrospora TaxID=1849047 RepID=A0A3D8Q609_9HELO|nr:hypothetical protein BP6252_13893 [Coleophoma cylindrospora]